MKISLTLTTILVTFSLLGCGEEQPSVNDVATMITTPYRASDEKIELIKGSIDKLAVGDTKEKVVEILGPADEIRPMYDRGDLISPNPLSKPKPAGESFWYILARDSDTGSHFEKNESLVRIIFSLDGVITRINQWGRDFPDSPDTLKQ